MPQIAVFFLFVIIFGGMISKWISDNSELIIQTITWSALGIIGLYSFILLIDKAKKDQEKESSRLEKMRLDEERVARKKAEEAASRYNSLIEIRQNALSFLSNGPAKLKSAEELLEAALSDFEERAFYPFWDNIEKAALSVLDFNRRLERLSQDSIDYPKLASEIDKDVPEFPVTKNLVEKLSISLETVRRIRRAERLAHRDFEFSSIYATRKTNNILISGFQNLSDALTNINNSMEGVIDKLESGFSSVVDAQNRTTTSIIRSGELLSDQLSTLSDSTLAYQRQSISLQEELKSRNVESAERERFAIQALDNIQRDRKPLEDFKFFSNVRQMKDPGNL